MPVLSGLIRRIRTSRLCPGLSLPACPGLKPQGPLPQQRGSFWALRALHSGPRVGPAQGLSTQRPLGVDPGLTCLRLTPQPSHWTAQGWQTDCARGPVDGWLQRWVEKGAEAACGLQGKAESGGSVPS